VLSVMSSSGGHHDAYKKAAQFVRSQQVVFYSVLRAGKAPGLSFSLLKELETVAGILSILAGDRDLLERAVRPNL